MTETHSHDAAPMPGAAPAAHDVRISLVIPAYNEAAYLPRLLASISQARAAYKGVPSDIEIIVSDNDSTDDTAAVAQAAGCRVVKTSIRRIGAVRNAGARAAHGEIIAFIDADSLRIHEQTFNALETALNRGDIVAGSTGVTMERWSPGIVATFALLTPIAWATRVDAGVVFCRRADFETVGGYRENMRYAEDVMFLFDMRRLGKTRGQRLTRLRRFKATASARKFDEHGDWHYFPMIARAALRLLGFVNADRFADKYWYEPRR